jgi:hypothetical protein
MLWLHASSVDLVPKMLSTPPLHSAVDVLLIHHSAQTLVLATSSSLHLQKHFKGKHFLQEDEMKAEVYQQM